MKAARTNEFGNAVSGKVCVGFETGARVSAFTAETAFLGAGLSRDQGCSVWLGIPVAVDLDSLGPSRIAPVPAGIWGPVSFSEPSCSETGRQYSPYRTFIWGRGGTVLRIRITSESSVPQLVPEHFNDVRRGPE